MRSRGTGPVVEKTADQLRAELVSLESMVTALESKQKGVLADIEQRKVGVAKWEADVKAREEALVRKERELDKERLAVGVAQKDGLSRLAAAEALLQERDAALKEREVRLMERTRVFEEEEHRLQDWRASLTETQRQVDQVLAEAQRVLRESGKGVK